MKLTYIMPLLASLTVATRTPEESEFTSLSESSVSTAITPTTSTDVVAPSLVVRKPLLNIDSSILKIVGDSILTTLAIKVAASEPTKLAAIAPAITDSSSALVPTLVERELRRPEDKLAGITCDTKRQGYEDLAAIRPINRGYEYLWKVGSYWTSDPGDHDRVSCSWTSGIFIINETPESKVIAFARVADLARDIRIKCGDVGANSVNGEVTDASGLIIVVSWANC